MFSHKLHLPLCQLLFSMCHNGASPNAQVEEWLCLTRGRIVPHGPICLLHYADHANHTKTTVNVIKLQRVQSMPSLDIISLSLIRTQHFINFYCKECIWNLKKFWNSAISNDHAQCVLCMREIVVPVCFCEVVTHMFLTLGRYLMYALGK